MVIVTFRFMVN